MSCLESRYCYLKIHCIMFPLSLFSKSLSEESQTTVLLIPQLIIPLIDSIYIKYNLIFSTCIFTVGIFSYSSLFILTDVCIRQKCPLVDLHRYWQKKCETRFLHFFKWKEESQARMFQTTNLNADPMSRPICLAECKVIKTQSGRRHTVGQFRQIGPGDQCIFESSLPSTAG